MQNCRMRQLTITTQYNMKDMNEIVAHEKRLAMKSHPQCPNNNHQQ